MVSLEEALDAHLDRIIETTKNLYQQEDSICKACHRTHKDIYCMLCYCPLYSIYDCGGNPVYTNQGIKDCSFCNRVHDKEFIKRIFKERLYELVVP